MAQSLTPRNVATPGREIVAGLADFVLQDSIVIYLENITKFDPGLDVGWIQFKVAPLTRSADVLGPRGAGQGWGFIHGVRRLVFDVFKWRLKLGQKVFVQFELDAGLETLKLV